MCELVAVGWRTDAWTDKLPRKEVGVGWRAGVGLELFFFFLYSEEPSEAETMRLCSPLYTHLL